MVTPRRILVCLRTVLETLLFDIDRFSVLITFCATSLKLVFGMGGGLLLGGAPGLTYVLILHIRAVKRQ